MSASSRVLSPIQALAQCLIGSGVVLGVIWLLWLGISYPKVGHALGQSFAAIGAGIGFVGHVLEFVLIPIEHAIFWVVTEIFLGFKAFFSWPAKDPIGFGVVIPVVILSCVCLLYKIRNHQIRMDAVLEKKWETRIGFLLVTSIFYSIISVLIAAMAGQNESPDQYMGEVTFHHQLREMDNATPNADFSKQVANANHELSQYGYERGNHFVYAPETPVVLIDAQKRIAAFSASMNMRTCQDLSRPNNRFVAHSINGHLIDKTSNFKILCSALIQNNVVVYNRPSEWPIPK